MQMNRLESNSSHSGAIFGTNYETFQCQKKLAECEKNEKIMNGIMESYTHHYELALEAAKKLIWNEPIEKAQPLKLEDLPNEDDI